MDIGKKIITLRQRRGLSQNELREKLGVSRQTISKWENGQVLPDAYNLKALAKILDISVDALLSDEELNIDKTDHKKILGYILLVFGLLLILIAIITGIFFKDGLVPLTRFAAVFGIFISVFGTFLIFYKGKLF